QSTVGDSRLATLDLLTLAGPAIQIPPEELQGFRPSLLDRLVVRAILAALIPQESVSGALENIRRVRDGVLLQFGFGDRNVRVHALVVATIQSENRSFGFFVRRRF